MGRAESFPQVSLLSFHIDQKKFVGTSSGQEMEVFSVTCFLYYLHFEAPVTISTCVSVAMLPF